MTIEIGTISHGTLRTRDLLDAFLPIIEQENPSEYDDLMALAGDAGTAYRLGWDDDLLMSEWLFDDVWLIMEELAPAGTYFGNTEGDGSDFGFWEDIDDEDGLP